MMLYLEEIVHQWLEEEVIIHKTFIINATIFNIYTNLYKII